MAADLGAVVTTITERLDTAYNWNTLEIGQVFRLPTLVEVTWDAIYKFAEATGDWTSLHFDHKKAVEAGYRGCIAHGGLTVNMLPGTLYRLNFWDETIDLLREITPKWRAAVYPGDRIHFELMVKAKFSKINDTRRGRVIFDFVIKNQRNEIVVTGMLSVFLKMRGDT